MPNGTLAYRLAVVSETEPRLDPRIGVAFVDDNTLGYELLGKAPARIIMYKLT